MPKRVRNHEEILHERLRDPKYAAGYLNAVLEDKGPDHKERFLMALRDVAQSHGMSRLAGETEIAREAMYRALSQNGNPEFETLTSVLDAVGLRLAIEPKKQAF